MEIHDPAAFLDYYDKVRQRTDRVVAFIPPERIEWTYREGKSDVWGIDPAASASVLPIPVDIDCSEAVKC